MLKSFQHYYYNSKTITKFYNSKETKYNFLINSFKNDNEYILIEIINNTKDNILLNLNINNIDYELKNNKSNFLFLNNNFSLKVNKINKTNKINKIQKNIIDTPKIEIYIYNIDLILNDSNIINMIIANNNMLFNVLNKIYPDLSDLLLTPDIEINLKKEDNILEQSNIEYLLKLKNYLLEKIKYIDSIIEDSTDIL